MPRIIVTSRYLKRGSKKNLKNYVKYIATREGSVQIPNMNKSAPATKNQQELISSLLNDFPDSKELFEYEDYIKNPTVKNGSALISEVIDRNMDRLTNRENYVGYLANRPGAVKFNSHGLFNEKDEPINLEKVAKEIADHGGNVYTHVVSLRRDDAQKMGYDNLKAWRDLVIRQIPNIAKNQKIDMKNLRWYAAFHDKKTNPHVHIIVYSTNEREGFLTNHGIEKIRSGFANDIYADELHHIYEQQTNLRNLLKKESEQLMKQIAMSISQDNKFDAELINLVSKLHGQLAESKGKKVYGYLKFDVKKTVDEIFSKLASNESIKKMYELWCEMEQQKHDVYSSARVDSPSLVDNKEFKSVKNMIIQTVMKMDYPTDDVEIEIPEPTEFDLDIPTQINEELIDETITDNVENSPNNRYYIKWSDSYKEACELIYDNKSKLDDYKKAEKLLLSESNNVLALLALGKLYSTEKLGAKDDDKSFEFYKKALQGFIQIEPTAKKLKPYLQYQIGKMYCYGSGTEQDYSESLKWFMKSAKEENKFAQFSLANLYYYGNGVEKDLSQAFLWYKKSAKKGHPYAAYALAQMYSKSDFAAKDKNQAQTYYKQALSGFLMLESKEQADDNLFYKIGAMYKNGLGTEKNMTLAIDYFKRSAEMNNKNGLYEYGRALLLCEHISQESEKAVILLEKSIKLGNFNAKRFLALEFISGEHLEKNIEKGISLLTECVDSGDAFSCYKLGTLYLKGEIVNQDLDKAEKYLLLAAEAENQYALYSLVKLYLENEKYDLDKAVEYLEKAVQYEEIQPYAAYSLAKILLDDNSYHDAERAVKLLESAVDENNCASFLLGKLYLFGTGDIQKNKEKAMKFLNLSAEQGNEYARNLLENTEQFENEMLANTIFSLFANLSRCIEDDYHNKFQSGRRMIDSKLRRMIQEKNQALGIKQEHGQTQEY